MKLAIGIYIIAGIIDIVLGSTYFFSQQFMSYHAEAVGSSWQELNSGLQTLILALMKLAGGGWFALGLLTIVVAVATVKTRSDINRWTLPAATLISWSASFAATWSVYRATGAATPWAPSAVMTGLAILALAIDAPQAPRNPDTDAENHGRQVQ